MDAIVKQRLLTSIHQDRLVLFLGAGVSIGPPSNLPSAARLAEEISAKYSTRALPLDLPPGSENDLEKLATFFVASGQQEYFLHNLIDWTPFNDRPNIGHAAVADLLTCEGLQVAVSTNYDRLIEKAAEALGEKDFDAALDGVSVARPRRHRPLLKIHGCVRDKDHTLWSVIQLAKGTTSQANKELRTRVRRSHDWLKANLSHRDLVFVGFWSDWHYLNRLFSTSLRAVHPPMVVLVDPADEGWLKAKAPTLWTWSHGTGVDFFHVPQTGNDFLNELRAAFSENFLQQSLISGLNMMTIPPGTTAPATSFSGLDCPSLYDLRRDFNGVPSDRIARARTPDMSMTAASRVHLKLRIRGANLDGPDYILPDGTRVRVVNALTRALYEVASDFSTEPPRVNNADIVIAAGAEDTGPVATSIVRATGVASVVRPGPVSEWITSHEAMSRGIL